LPPTGGSGGSHRLRATAGPPRPRRSPSTRRPPLRCGPPVACGAAPGEHARTEGAPFRLRAPLERRAAPGPAARARAPASPPGPPRQGESAAGV